LILLWTHFEIKFGGPLPYGDERIRRGVFHLSNSFAVEWNSGLNRSRRPPKWMRPYLKSWSDIFVFGQLTFDILPRMNAGDSYWFHAKAWLPSVGS
jgi:hypothetical protein